MAFRNATVEIQLGNVESRLVGPAPQEALDRALNPRLATGRAAAGKTAVVYDPERNAVLTGAVPLAKRVLRRAGVRVRLRDHRRRAPRALRVALRPDLTLRPYQAEVVEAALRHGRGKVDVGTAGGKTLLAAAIIARLGLPTLYLVTTRTLLHQAAVALAGMLGDEPGVVGAGVERPAPLTVALVQALEPHRRAVERWRGGVLVFDEGHHAAAVTCLDLIRAVAPRYHFYLSAVPFRSGADQVVLDALAGASLTGGRYSAQYLVDHGYACPVRVRLEHVALEGSCRERPFAAIYRQQVVDNRRRNALIAGIARDEAARGRSVLVLVDHVRHGHALLGLLGPGAAFIHGAWPSAALRREVGRFADGSLRLLVATAGLFQEGVSIDGIEVLIQGGGLKSRTKVLQSVGRGMRRAPGKDSCLYVDFWDDDDLGLLAAHSRERLRLLRDEGFPVPPPPGRKPPRGDSGPEPPTWVHVPGSRRFVRMGPTGTIHGRGECLSAELVPQPLCQRCPNDRACVRGGIVTWHDDRE